VNLPKHVTHRTLRVLAAIGDRPGASNSEIATVAGIADAGQSSKLLARLESSRLIRNGASQRPPWARNEWYLTLQGQELEGAMRVHLGC